MSDTPQFKRALVIKLRHHGDVLLTSPVFTVLAQACPGIEIDALVYDETRDMLQGHPAIAQLHTVGRNWRGSWLGGIKAWWRLFSTLRRRDYDLIVSLTDHWHGARLARLLRPRVSVAPQAEKGSAFSNKLWQRSFTAVYPELSKNTRHTV
ncbi:MAG TPA: putative lipopolysaccharide heptosyltransferase III, partial [Chitinolyticbacter sp.]|nr:putative lipopolysaccharide heptosyltransferase III [Chitinolyticbacter sp.]